MVPFPGILSRINTHSPILVFNQRASFRIIPESDFIRRINKNLPDRKDREVETGGSPSQREPDEGQA